MAINDVVFSGFVGAEDDVEVPLTLREPIGSVGEPPVSYEIKPCETHRSVVLRHQTRIEIGRNLFNETGKIARNGSG